MDIGLALIAATLMVAAGFTGLQSGQTKYPTFKALKSSKSAKRPQSPQKVLKIYRKRKTRVNGCYEKV